MCLAIPGRVVAVGGDRPDVATVDVVGVKRTINVALLDSGSVHVGDWVLIHVGFAMAKIDEAEAEATLAALESMGQLWTDEVDAIRGAEGATG